jgi:lipopolysaccharide export system permease protein
MWLPVVVLTPVAIYLTYKATNDSSLLDMDWYDVRIRKFRRSVAKYMPSWMNKEAKKHKNVK